MNDKLKLVSLLGVLLLAGCGQSGQPGTIAAPPASNAPTAPEGPVSPAPKPEPMSASVLASAKPTGQQCSFDSDPNVTIGKQNTLRGWFLDPSKQPAGAFTFVLVGEHDFAISAKTGVLRADVGAYLGDPALSSAGYAFSSTLESVPPGTYGVRLLVEQGNSAYVCDVKQKIVVSPKTE